MLEPCLPRPFVFEPVTIVPALLTLSTWKALLDFTHHSNSTWNNFKWLCCRPRTFLLGKKFASKLSGLVSRRAELGLTVRCPALLAALPPQLCKQWQERSWGFNSWQAPCCLQTGLKLQHKQFSLVPSCKEPSKSTASRCSKQCFQFSPAHKPNVSQGWLVHPLYAFTYDLLHTDSYCVRNALPRRLLSTSEIKKQYSRPILNNFYHKNPIS